MRKYYPIIIIGIIIGIVSTWIISAISETYFHPEAALLQPINNGKMTFTDRTIETAQQLIKKQPDDPKGYNQLSAALIQKARETGDFSLNTLAEEALKQSFKLDPDNFNALKLQATLLLSYHRFAEALQFVQRAQAIKPKDHELYGAMVDALVELGEYEKAVDAAQNMVDLRPDTASYSRISYLRSLHGDTKGAIEAMKMAAESASPQIPEIGAWCRVHLGDELINDGKLDEAEHQYDHALYLMPEYHTALAAKARARYAAGDFANAEVFFKRAIERVPSPDYVAALGDLYAKTGRMDEAKQQYEQVEFIEKTGTNAGTYSRQLALFWADHDIRLDEALSVAENEIKARNDIYASDLLAWCLYKKGRFGEAKSAIDKAMRLKTRDPKLFYHAGMIALALNDNNKGVEYLKQALSINPSFDILQSEIAEQKLNGLKS